MKWVGTVIIVGLCACAGPEKMSWPYAPTPEPPPPPPPVAQGGAMEDVAVEEPLPLLRPRVVPPEHDVPQDGRNYLVISWPIPATGVNSLFGSRQDPIDGTARYHAGVDLDAEYGTIIEASAAGWVSTATWHAGHGRRVVVEHAGGYQTVYSHLSQILAVAGTWVRTGDAIGRVGNSGRSTGPHLHFEINRWGEHLDPLDYLAVPVPLD